MKAITIACGLLLAAFLFVPARAADDPKADKEMSVADISMDIDALRAFYSLHMTDEQLKAVAKLAKDTAEKQRKRNNVKVSDEYRKALTELREALVDASDDDKIGELEDQIEAISDKEKVDLDNSFDVTKAARKRTRDVVNLLKPDQLATYYSDAAEDVPDPVADLTKGLEGVRGLKNNEWREKRDEIADNVAWAVAGVDADATEKVYDKVVVLLTKAHGMSAEEFKKKSAELEKDAKALVGDVGSDKLLLHHAERTIAEMLSNPRLEAAIRARLK